MRSRAGKRFVLPVALATVSLAGDRETRSGRAVEARQPPHLYHEALRARHVHDHGRDRRLPRCQGQRHAGRR